LSYQRSDLPEDAYDALSLEVIFRERALYLVALLRKMTCNLRQPMHLRHPVQGDAYGVCACDVLKTHLTRHMGTMFRRPCHVSKTHIIWDILPI